ncbi:hypothetical protein ACOME3_001467 [Neoechinorhynchus agilis]
MPSGPNLQIIGDFAELLHTHKYLEDVLCLAFVQEEVAERFFVEENNRLRTRFSVLCQIHFEMEHLLTLSGSSLFPKSSVNIAFMKFKPRKTVGSFPSFESISKVLSAVFSAKNQAVKHSFRLYLRKVPMNVERCVWEALSKSNLDVDMKCVELSNDHILSIAEKIDELLNKQNV